MKNKKSGKTMVLFKEVIEFVKDLFRFLLAVSLIMFVYSLPVLLWLYIMMKIWGVKCLH